jgi:DMSO/TMAO reductase YedYZ molybdopterin-dependent catalytic subunit
MDRYPPARDVAYVRMDAENDDYYVGLDMQSCRHPQSLLAYEMAGKPLTAEHGAPLRLVIPVKYGIKNIKLITRITYSPHRPGDFWAESGYDWYAGL